MIQGSLSLTQQTSTAYVMWWCVGCWVVAECWWSDSKHWCI